MRIHSLLLSFSLLTGCTSVPAISTEAPAAEALPGLAYPNLGKAKAMPAPSAIARLLLSLPVHDVLASQELRRRYLQGDVLVLEVHGQASSKDYLVADREGAWYGFWIRSFHGARPELTGYLVEVRGECAGLRGTDPAYEAPVAEAKRQCAVTGAGHFDSGLRAYRVVDGQPPEDVTASIAPDPAVSSKAMLEHYASIGASEVFALDDNLHRLPVFRWVMEFDPENTSRSLDPPIFDGGHHAHAGFVVWDGDRFERRATVPHALWPCRVGRPNECPARSSYDDPFVTD